MRRKFLCLSLLPLALASDAPACDATGDVSALKRRAAELFAGGNAAVADACLGAALAALTSQLEALAAEAESLQAYRQARRTAASNSILVRPYRRTSGATRGPGSSTSSSGASSARRCWSEYL